MTGIAHGIESSLPAGAAEAPDARLWPGRMAASARALLVAGAALHLVLAVTLGLSPDEAHYALYGAHPDWSYYDHPPLVGWLQSPFVRAGGSDLAMRCVPMASWLLTAAWTMHACRVLPLVPAASPGDRARRDLWAVGLLILSPMLFLLGVALVPDSLLMPLVPAAMVLTWRLRDTTVAARARAWLPLAAVLGIAVLAKYTAVFLVLGALASLAWFHPLRLLRLRGFWMAAAIVAVMSAPVIFWNVRHHWASLAYQGAHAAGAHAWRPVDALRAVAVQCLIYGPVLILAAMRGARGVGTGADGPIREARTDARTMVLLFGMPLGLTAMILAGRGPSLPHWTASAWTALVPLAVAGMMTMPRPWSRRLVAWQALFLAALLAALWAGGPHAEPAAGAAPATTVPPSKALPNPVADLYGWEMAAHHAAMLARARGVPSIAVINWSLASRLAWYARPMPVRVVHDRGDQFSLWFGTLARGDSAILVDWSQMSFPPPVGPGEFRRCVPIDQVVALHAGRQLSHFSFSWCQDWQG